MLLDLFEEIKKEISKGKNKKILVILPESTQARVLAQITEDMKILKKCKRVSYHPCYIETVKNLKIIFTTSDRITHKHLRGYRFDTCYTCYSEIFTITPETKSLFYDTTVTHIY